MQTARQQGLCELACRRSCGDRCMKLFRHRLLCFLSARPASRQLFGNVAEFFLIHSRVPASYCVTITVKVTLCVALPEVAVTVMVSVSGAGPGAAQPIVNPASARISIAASAHCRRTRRWRMDAISAAPSATSRVPSARIASGGPVTGACGLCNPGPTSADPTVVNVTITCVIGAVPSAAGRVFPEKPGAELAKVHPPRFGNSEQANCTLAGKSVFAVVGMIVKVVLAEAPPVTLAETGLADIMKFVPTPNDSLLLVPPAVVTDTACVGVVALPAIANVAVIVVLLTTVAFDTVMPWPADTFTLKADSETKFVPVIVTVVIVELR